MKRCPECRRNYYDDSLLYCLDDGAALLEGPADEPPTVRISDPGGESRTRLYEDSLGTVGQSAARSTFGSRSSQSKRRHWVIASLAVLIVGAACFVFFYVGVGDRPISPRENMKFTEIPVTGDVGEAFISPDGQFMARIVREKNGYSIKLRQLASTAEREILAPIKLDFRGGLIFSHDGNNIYYVAGDQEQSSRQLFRVSILGGDPRRLLEHVDSGVTLSPDGRRLAFRRRKEEASPKYELIIANEDGSGEEVFATWTAENALIQPIWSPDGQVIAALFEKKDEQGQYYTIEAIDLTSRTTQAVSQGGWLYINSLRWLPTGEGILVTGKPRLAPSQDESQLWFLPYPSGEPQKITHDTNNYTFFSISADGRTGLLQNVNYASNIWVLPGADTAKARQITNSNSDLGELVWTPAGQIVYSGRSTTRFLDLWRIDADGSNNKQLTFTPEHHEVTPSVSPDGTQIVYVIGQNNFFTIARIGIEGGSSTELVRDVIRYSVPTFSADSKLIYFNRAENAGDRGSLWAIPANGGEPIKLRHQPCHVSLDSSHFVCADIEPPSGKLKAVIASAATGDVLGSIEWPAGARAIFWSPDGKSLDFIADREGTSNVWRMSLDGTKQQKITDWQTPGTSYAFAWSRNGQDLAVVRDSQSSDIILINNFRP